MLAIPLSPTTATSVALFRVRPHSPCKFRSACILWLLLLCAWCWLFCLVPAAYAHSVPAQNPPRATSSGFGSDTGFTYQVPELGPRIIRSRAHDGGAAPQPDVEALDVTWSPANPQSGDLVKFSALVTNLGNAPVPEYTVEFYLQNETGEISYFASYWDPQPLNPGQTRWVTGGSNWNWGFWTATPGSHIALVVINDSYGSLTKTLYVPPAPLASLTATGGDGQISLTWAAVPGATSYNLYRSAAPGGEGSTPYQAGLTATSYVDASLPSGTTYYYTFTAIGAQGESAQSNEAGATVQSFGPGRVRFYPRASFEGRMLGGKFQGSNDGASYTDLATITSVPAASQYTQQALSADPKLFRYLRYLSPSGGYCDLAELEFYSGTSATKLMGTIFGTPGTWGNDCTRVFDGKPDTFFDAPVANGAYVGLRQASPFTLTAMAGTSQISLSWTSVAGASGYNVRRGTVSGGPYVVIAPSCTGTSYADNTAVRGVPYFYIVTALSSGGESAYTNEAIAKIGSVLAPYGNSPVTVSADSATTVEAENYDMGGEGIAYHDIDNGNQSAYRSDNIGVASDGNASNGYVVGDAQGGEWDGYWLNVAKAGAYAITTTIASPSSGGTFHLEFGPVGQVGGAGVTQTPEMTVPSTGGWSNYEPVTLPAVALPAGPLWMRLVLDYGGNGHYVANFDSFTINPSATSKNLRPYGGSPVLVAASGKTMVEAENYDLGGEGVAYHDVDNGGLADYRSDNIGVYVDGSASSGHAVGYAQQGEWEGYTLNAAGGSYVLTAHLANPAGGGTFHIEFGPVGQVGGAGIIQSGEFTVPNTGNWGNYQDITLPAVNLPAGPLWMRVVLDSGSAGFGPYLANFDCFSLTPAGPATPTGLTASAGNSQIVLAWNASAGAASYNLYRSMTAGQEGATPYKTGLTSTNYTDLNVTNGPTYYFQVTAVGADRTESARSNEAHATPPGTPSVSVTWAHGYQAVSGFLPSPKLVDLAPGDMTTGYTVTQPPVPGSSGTSAGLTAQYDLGPTPQRIGKATVTGAALGSYYGQVQAVLEYSSDGVTWQSIGSSQYLYAPAHSTLTFTPYQGSSPAPRYWRCSLQAYGNSSSEAVQVSATDFRLYDGQGNPIDPGSLPPAVPTGLTGIAGDAQTTLSWTGSAGAMAYHLKRASTAGGPYLTIASPTGSATTYSDTGLTNGTTYFYVLSAINDIGGESANSNEAQVTPLTVKLSSVYFDTDLKAVTSGAPATVVGGTAATGTVTLTGPAPMGGVVVQLTNGSPAVTVPDAVTIPEGKTSQTFAVATRSVTAPTTATVKAVSGSLSRSGTLTLLPLLAGVSLKPPALVGGDSSVGTISFNGKAPIAVTVGLTSSFQRATVPPSIPVAAGDTSETFPITTQAVPTVVAAKVSATVQGVTKGATLTIQPPLSYGGDLMSLTAEGIAEGFQLTTSASGFYNQNRVGPLGSALLPDGTVFVNNAQLDTLYKFADRDNQTVEDAISSVKYTPSNSLQLGSLRVACSSIYMGIDLTGELLELNPDGSPNRTVTRLGHLDGIDVSPRNNHLIASSGYNIYDVDPVSGTQKLLVQSGFLSIDGVGIQDIDGVAVSHDGSVVFGADNYTNRILGFSTVTGQIVFRSAYISGPDGMAIGSGYLSNRLFVNNNYGEVWELDISGVDGAHPINSDAPYPDMVLIAQGGSRGDFIGFGSGGSLLLSQSDSVMRLIPPPSAAFGLPVSTAIHMRDDLPRQISPQSKTVTSQYRPIHIADSWTTGVSADLAQFDTLDTQGKVMAARVQRAGQLLVSPSAQIDFQLGVRSINPNAFNPDADGAPVSYGPVQETVQTPAAGAPYLASWELPDPMVSDLQAQVGSLYHLALIDRLSSVCGPYQVLDTPQQNWPTGKNALIYAVSHPGSPLIPQGRALDISLSDSDLPLNGTWDILLGHTIVASSGTPNGWDVEANHIPDLGSVLYRGVIVTVPPTAALADCTSYTVRYAGFLAGSGTFAVTATGSSVSAPMLQPLTLQASSVRGSASVAGLVTLDAPAPIGGAAVVLTTDNAAALVTPSVFIPEGQTSARILVQTQAVLALTPVSVKASYNGYRWAALAVLDPNGTAPGAPQNLSATAGDQLVTLHWTAPTGTDPMSVTYNVKRGLTHNGPYTTIFSGLASTLYTDLAVSNGTTYYYVVSAVNAYGEGPASNEASAAPTGGQVATPVISPHGGTFTGSVFVTLVDATPLAEIRYTTDGSDPNAGSRLYGARFSLTTTATVKARAFKQGVFPSDVAAADFTINPVNPVVIVDAYCGGTATDTLGPQYEGDSRGGTGSQFNLRGPGFYAKDYRFTGQAGSTVTLSLSSTQFDAYLYLFQVDAQGTPHVLAEDDDSGGGSNAQVTYTLPADGIYYVEATSFKPGEAGRYTLHLDCGSNYGYPSSIYVTTENAYVPNNGTVTFDPTPVGAPETKTFTINNYGWGSALTIGPPTVTGDFVLGQAPTASVPSYGSTSFTVRFNATAAGDATGTVAFSTNDPNNNPFTIHLAATATSGASVRITAPASGTHFDVGTNLVASVPISATAATTVAGATLTVIKFCATNTATNAVQEIGEKDLTSLAAAEVNANVTWGNAAAGQYTLTATVTDSLGNTATSARVPISVGTQVQLPPPTITPSGSGPVLVTLSDIDPMTQRPTGATLFYTLDGTDPDTNSKRIRYTGPFLLTELAAGQPRTVTVTARAYQDGSLTSAPASAAVSITTSGAGSPLTVVVTAPADGTPITGPVTATGTVSGGTSSYSWSWDYRPAGSADSAWTHFGAGTSGQNPGGGDNQGDGPPTDNMGALFDTTLLLNGLYELRLTVTDTAGDTNFATVTILVKGNQKVGQFSLSYTDLSVNTGGMPITVVRTYDSRNKADAGLGIGWTLSTTDMRLQKAHGAIGEGWKQVNKGGNFQYPEDKPHLITFTLPNGDVNVFWAQIDPPSSLFSLTDTGAKVKYVPVFGTTSSLMVKGGNADGDDVVVEQSDGGVVTLKNYDLNVYDPDEFLLKTRDGTIYDIKEGQGLQSATDRHGNAESFNNGNFTTNTGSGPVTGVTVTYTASGATVTDPNGHQILYTKDIGTGNLASVTDRSKATTSYDYDTDHNLTAIHDPRSGQTQNLPVRNYYRADGRLDYTLDAFNNRTSYAYNLSDQKVSTMAAHSETITGRKGNATDAPNDQVTTLTYDGYGNVTGKTQYKIASDGDEGFYSKPITTTMEFGDGANPDKKTREIDPGGTDQSGNALPGNETTWKYSPQGDMLEETHIHKLVDPVTKQITSQELTTQYTYNAYGQVETVTDPLHSSLSTPQYLTENHYDDVGNLRWTKDAAGHITNYDYDPNVSGAPRGALTQVTDALKHTTKYSYQNGQVQTVTDANHHDTTFDYWLDGTKKSQTTTRTNPDGTVSTLVTQFDYDANGRLHHTTRPDHTETWTFYNELGKVDHTIDAQNLTTSFKYDDQGQLKETDYPDGTFTATTYLPDGQKETSRDRAGRVTAYQYDTFGRLVRTTNPDLSTTETAYDDAGRVLSETDENKHSTFYKYDDLGHKTDVKDVMGFTTHYDYDDNGQQAAVTDGNGHTTTYEYDDAGQLTFTHYGVTPDKPDGDFTTQTKYDELGRKQVQYDAMRRPTTYDYDLLGRLWHVTTPMGHTTTFGYDELGEKISQVDANHLAQVNPPMTQWAYDPAGRVIKHTLPAGQSESMDYDAAGRLWHHTDFNGDTTTFSYDPQTGRLMGKSDTTGQAVSYTYYADARRSGKRQTATRTTPTGSVTVGYDYDANGQLWKVINPAPLGTIVYTYDSTGNKKTVQTPSGTTTYDYDADNRLWKIHSSDGATTVYGYDKVGNRWSVTRPNGVTTRYTYDPENRLTDLVNYTGPDGMPSVLTRHQYTLSDDGKRQKVIETGSAIGAGVYETDYTYDDDGRLTEETRKNASSAATNDVVYGYDNVGNRLTMMVNGGVPSVYHYDADDRLGSVTTGQNGPQTASYGYDNDGNMTLVNGRVYSFDFENRLVGVTYNNAPVAAYVYDADGNRLSQTAADGTVTAYLVDTSLPFASVVEERSASGNLLARYDYGDELLRMDRGGATSYYLSDGLGSTRALTNAAGVVTDGESYDAFGGLLAASSLGGTVNPFLFNGQQLDGTGLYFLRARYYAPTIGRFLAQDPYSGSDEDPISLHRYLYTSDNPVNRIDPSGQADLAEALFSIGTASFIAGAILFNPSPANAPGPSDPIYADHSDADTLYYIIGGEVTGRVVGYLGARYIGPLAKAVLTRIFSKGDEATAQFLADGVNARTALQIPNRVGNVALVRGSIGGQTFDVVAASGSRNLEGTVGATQDPVFEATQVGSYIRDYDAEKNALEHIFSRITDTDATGELKIYSEKPVCDSCYVVIQQFKAKYPHVKVRIWDGRYEGTNIPKY